MTTPQPPVVPGPDQPYRLGDIMAPPPPRRRSRAPVVVLALAAAVGLLAGGAAYTLSRGGESSPDPVVVAATGTPTVQASPSASAPSPTPAATSGKLGTVVPTTLGGDKYTVAALRYARFNDGAGSTYGTVEARLCVDKTNPRPITVSSAPWALLYAESEQRVQISGGGLKTPEYPSAVGGGQGRAVQPGKCIRGWIHFELVDGKDPEAVEYSGQTPSGETFTFAWTV